MPSLPKKILRLTQFASDPTGHGACRRSLQIRELCEQIGFVVEDISLEPPPNSRLTRYWRSLRWLRPLGQNVSHLRYGPGLIGAYDFALHHALGNFAGSRVVLWERTYDRLLPAIARRYGYRVIALPHNLETLCPDEPPTGYSLPAAFHDEIARLGDADARFMIAREEQWLLANLGLDAGYLPYFPPAPVAAQLRLIRARRTTNPPRRNVLVLGNALYPPTAAGMRTVIRELASLLPSGWRVVVAGFGSDTLRDEARPGVVELRGAVSTSDLETLLGEASVLVANQDRGAGALTRIPEALMAGIPVLANVIAARSAAELAGVYVYHRTQHLNELLHSDLPMPPEPSVPIHSNAHLQCVLQTLVEKSRAGHSD